MSTSSVPRPRRRLGVDDRRAELLGAGVRLLAAHSYDEITVAMVAAEASASPGLIYHYFQNKHGYFLAVVEREAARLAEATRTRSELPPRDRLIASLDGYLDYVQESPLAYKALYRGAMGADAGVRAIMDANLALQGERLLEALSPDEPPPVLLVITVRGWLSYLVTACLNWIDLGGVSRDDLRDLCLRTLADSLSHLRNVS
ncbi:TetR/AcrR family transcriptional regulator [Gordonia caeni]|uniref:TetR/AcrR family transcriptional regulator n=1 Tax=Gordonia caeni TaxID=1007097 RepID=A0ABP7NIG2_9ACTN